MSNESENILRDFVKSLTGTCASCFRMNTAACITCPVGEAKAVLRHTDTVRHVSLLVGEHSPVMKRRILRILRQLCPSLPAVRISVKRCPRKSVSNTLAAMSHEGLIAKAAQNGVTLYRITQKGIEYAELIGDVCNPQGKLAGVAGGRDTRRAGPVLAPAALPQARGRRVQPQPGQGDARGGGEEISGLHQADASPAPACEHACTTERKTGNE